MKTWSRLLAASTCLILIGCLGADDGSGGCPNGEEPRVTVFDLGENPRGAPSARAAVGRFLRDRGSDLTAGSFELVETDAHTANFTHNGGGTQLARLYVERLDRGWLVISYEACVGAL
jgi:hypothetical protein